MDKFGKVDSSQLIVDSKKIPINCQLLTIGLLGGTFDPIHNAHIEIARIAQEKFHLDMVYFIVAKDPPVKDHVVLDAEKRFDLVLKALEPYEFLQASRLELDRPGKSYSYLTVEDYKKQFPDVELFWIMGEDAFLGLTEWKNFDYLKENLSFIVFSREVDSSELTVDSGQSVGLDFHFINDVSFGASSSHIKALLNKKIDSIQEIPENIMDLIVSYYGKD